MRVSVIVRDANTLACGKRLTVDFIKNVSASFYSFFFLVSDITVSMRVIRLVFLCFCHNL